MSRQNVEMSIEQDGQDVVAYPFVESDHVILANGMDIDSMIREDIATPIVNHEETSFKVGQGDSDVSSSIVDSSVGEITIKGQSYQNILPDPSLRSSMTNGKIMQKINEGYDSVNVVDGVAKSAILKGQTLVNLFDIDSVTDSPNKQGIYTDWITFSNNGSANYWKPYYNVVSRELTTGEKLIAFLYVDTNTIGDVTVQAPHNGYYLFPMNFGVISSTGVFKSNPFVINYAGGKTKDGEINFRCITSSPTVGEFKFRLLITPYQDGMENWDIPYFEGMQSVRMPVLTTFSNNLINPKTCLINYSLNTNDGSVKKGSYMNNYFTTDFIEVIEGLTYYRGTSAGELVYYNYNKEYVGAAKTESFTIPKGVKYIRTMGLISGLGVNQYVSIGSTATSYVPYKSNILTTTEEVELRGIGDVQDTLDLMTGELISRLGYTEHLLQDLFNFSTVFGREIQYDESSDRWYGRHNGINQSYFRNMLPINFSITNDVNANVSIFPVNSDWLAFCVKSSELVSKGYEATADGLLEYAKNEKMICIYKLPNKAIKTVDLSSIDQDGNDTYGVFKSFSNGHIQLSSGAENSLIPNLDYEVPTSNSYHLDLAKTSTKYTMKNMSGSFTLDGTRYNTSSNGTFTTPSALTNKLMICNTTQSEAMLLEGDVTNKILPHFKGIKSAFENEDKIEVLSTGKNLFDGELETGTIHTVGGTNTTGGYNEYYRSVGYVKIRPNKTYTLSTNFTMSKINIMFYFYDINKEYISSNGTASNKCKAPSNAHYLRFRFIHEGNDIESINVQVEEGETPTSYVKHESNNTKIPLLSPLRSATDGAYDEVVLDRENNKAKIIQRIDEDLTKLETPVITEVDLEGYPYIYKDGHIFLNSEIAPQTTIKYSINQAHQIESQNGDNIRIDKQITNLQKLIAQYVQVQYESALLNLRVKMRA